MITLIGSSQLPNNFITNKIYHYHEIRILNFIRLIFLFVTAQLPFPLIPELHI